jgi:hypothetical protein
LDYTEDSDFFHVLLQQKKLTEVLVDPANVESPLELRFLVCKHTKDDDMMNVKIYKSKLNLEGSSITLSTISEDGDF